MLVATAPPRFRGRIVASAINVRSRSQTLATTSSEPPRVLVETHENGITEVVLNRPHQHNALDLPMFRAIRDTIRNGIPSSTRCVILRGSGRSFSAGLDVASLVRSGHHRPDRELLERYHNGPSLNLAQEVAYGWRQLPVPVICAIHGHCYGGGLQIALGADIRYACSSTTRLSVMEGRYGLIPDMSASVTLRELLRIDVAKELTFTGRVVEAAEGQALGLLTRVIDGGESEADDESPVLKFARMKAREIVDKSPDALRLAKQMYHSTWIGMDESSALELESEYQKQVLLTWNQLAASGRRLAGVSLPYFVSKAPEGK